MIYGIGTDLIEVERVAKKVAKPDFKRKVYTEREIAYCEANYNSAESFAARFAAKEAFFKALGTGWQGFFSFCEVEILNDEKGKPTVFVHGKVKAFVEEQQFSNIQVSMSHLKSVASAVVIIER